MAAAVHSSSWKDNMARFFRAHGRFCASHPWEVIVTTVTVTVCVLSMSVLSEGKVGYVCGINKPCSAKAKEDEGTDVLLIIVNSLAVFYIYNQFSNLRKAGSKYLLGIAGLFTLFASFLFGSGVVKLINYKITGLNEALPFFLLLIDLSKASDLAKCAFRSRNKDEVHRNIALGMARIGPTLTLDTLVEVLLIGIGTLLGVRQLEVICCFGCLSIIANYVVFMTFFPAALALVLEVCPTDPHNHAWHLDELARDMQEEEKQPNPVVQRVKTIMALGLIAVHLHSHFFAGVTGFFLGLAPATDGGQEENPTSPIVEESEEVHLIEYVWWKTFNLSVDQIITVVLSTVLFVKYIFYDKTEPFSSSLPPSPALSRTNSSKNLHGEASSKTILPPISAPGKLELDPTVQDQMRQLQSKRLKLLMEDAGTVPPTIRCPFSITSLTSEADSNELIFPVKKALESSTELKEEVSDPPQKVTQETQTEEEVVLTNALPQRHLFTVDVDDSLSGGTSPTMPPAESIFPSGEISPATPPAECDVLPTKPRPLEECKIIFKSEAGASSLTDEEILALVAAKVIPAYQLETALGNPERGVLVRRKLISMELASMEALESLPYTHYNYSMVMGACCENVIGYMPIPVGVAGPLLIDGESFYVPMATTEGALVASTNRGCRAVGTCGGVKTHVIGDGMTRGPVVRFPSATQASAFKRWVDDQANFADIKQSFESTSRFAKLVSLHTALAGRLVYIRFKATTGDAMGMNMVSKGVEKALSHIGGRFAEMEIISLSGNYCTDKKSAAINWVEGRGKSVVCEAHIPAHVVKQVLKTNVDSLVELNINKNLIGSAMAGAIGGFNAHAANIVTAIFIATGQDPAQNIASSNCMTLMEKAGTNGEDLYMTCTMPSIEIGTVGGGTILSPQSACLKMLGTHGSHREIPGANATRLARIVCATVLVGELSLLSALAAGHLVKSHLSHNRSQLNLSTIHEDHSKSSS